MTPFRHLQNVTHTAPLSIREEGLFSPTFFSFSSFSIGEEEAEEEGTGIIFGNHSSMQLCTRHSYRKVVNTTGITRSPDSTLRQEGLIPCYFRLSRDLAGFSGVNLKSLSQSRALSAFPIREYLAVVPHLSMSFFSLALLPFSCEMKEIWNGVF